MESDMSRIMTVNGPIEPEELGFTSMHDHTLLNGICMRQRYEAFLPEDGDIRKDDPIMLENLGTLKHGFIMSLDAVINEDEELLTGELKDYRMMGGSAILDVSVPGLRCDPLALRRISRDSGVHIVAATGLYARDSWPERFIGLTMDELAAHMLKEISDGIGESDVLPGHLKIALEENFSEPEVNALRAACRVSRETGISLTVHQGMPLGPDDGLKIVDILEEEAVDLERVIIAHVDARITSRNIRELVTDPESRKIKLETPKKMMDRGVNISFDCFGHYWDAEALGTTCVNDWIRLAGLISLISDGYSRQLVVGTDSFIKFLLRRYGGEGYCRLLTFLVPMLKEFSVSDSDIDAIVRHNPARLLAY